MPKTFSNNLLNWYKQNQRELPWKEGRDPYKIWISEIILQQTRLAQGLPYYKKFVEAFPDVRSLANAEEDKVLKLWEGLGYYSRARNLHYSAKLVVNELNGLFPSSYEEIIKLKGIGPYTAAAIASFAFGLSYPVVDGNVLRLISRYFGIEESIDVPQTQKQIKKLCEQAIEKRDPAIFNQAIMDFGATICTPKKAGCDECPLNETCYAYAKNRVGELPVRSKKIKKKTRYFNYYLVESKGKILVSKRTENDIWKGLYEFPLVESVGQNEFLNARLETPEGIIVKGKQLQESQTFKHLLTHQTILVKFIHVNGNQKGKKYSAIAKKEIGKYAFPRVIQRYLEDLDFVSN